MRSSTERTVTNNLLRPSLLAWRAKHLAEKAARAKNPEKVDSKPPAAQRSTLSR